MKRIATFGFVIAAMMALPHSASAVTLGANELLGIIVPGTPADEDNRLTMVNGLLEGWGSVLGYNDGAATGTVLGNNPSDPNHEAYTLKYSATTVIPGTAPLATTWEPTVDGNPPPTFNLGNNTYDWIVVKWGRDAAVYYIGNLAPFTDITLSLAGTGFAAQGHGLSGYTLINGEVPSVPDGGSAAAMLGAALVALGVVRRRFGKA